MKPASAFGRQNNMNFTSGTHCQKNKIVHVKSTAGQ